MLQVNALELIVVVRTNSEAAGTPVGLPVRLSNPANRGAGRKILMVIVTPVAAVADIERNWSLPVVVVAVTYSVGMV